MKRLFGSHITPPDIAVVPPSLSVFSRTSADLPSVRISRAAHIEPPPLPTTMKSKLSSMACSPGAVTGGCLVLARLRGHPSKLFDRARRIKPGRLSQKRQTVEES